MYKELSDKELFA